MLVRRLCDDDDVTIEHAWMAQWTDDRDAHIAQYAQTVLSTPAAFVEALGTQLLTCVPLGIYAG